ncbi:MAG TPA: hypothetical protein VNH83_18050, partial [Bryobacteraceae bacterium]|nr:hypothetical protein [Bryobacteraceae bacterium]
MVEDFDPHLATMRVSGERELDPKLRGFAEGIWIVGQQNIGDVATHQRFNSSKHWRMLSLGIALALV